MSRCLVSAGELYPTQERSILLGIERPLSTRIRLSCVHGAYDPKFRHKIKPRCLVWRPHSPYTSPLERIETVEERFVLEGMNYYQQGRKCGKQGCKCVTGELHGPYWYAREIDSGQVRYLGRELPAEVLVAYTAHTRLLPQMTRRRRELLKQYDALGRLLKGETLWTEDRPIISLLGFGEALVCRDRSDIPQEN